LQRSLDRIRIWSVTCRHVRIWIRTGFRLFDVITCAVHNTFIWKRLKFLVAHIQISIKKLGNFSNFCCRTKI
jgi:hypothetical protein